MLGLSCAIAACGASDAGQSTTSSPSTLPQSTTATEESTTITSTTTTTIPPTTTTAPPTTTTTVPPAGPATYRLTVDNTWGEETHPGAVPPNAHFSWLAGATHDASVSIWSVGSPASPGTAEMAETGRTDILIDEIDATSGIGEKLDWPWWFCPPATQNAKCGELSVEFDTDPEHPYLSLAAMIGPSPDWFVGVDSLLLLEDGRWRRTVTVALMPFDAGTRASNRFELFGPRSDPPEPISEVTEQSAQLIGPQHIGTYVFELVTP